MGRGAIIMFNKIYRRLGYSQKLGLFIVVCVTVVVYGNIFGNHFVSDDYEYIVEWDLIRNLKNFPQFFGPGNQPEFQPGIYSPLKTLIHAITYQLFGLNTIGHHLLSITIHLIGVMLVYKICLLLVKDLSVAFLASLLFAVHPVHVESITFITASIDMVGIILLFWAFYLYLMTGEVKSKRYYYFFSVFVSLAAIFTYELALSIPFLFLFYELSLASQKSWISALRKTWIFFALAAGYVLMKLLVKGSIIRTGYVYGSFYLTMLVTIKAFARYVLICFWPVTLTINHTLAKGIFSFAWEDFDKSAVFSQSLFDLPTLSSLVLIVIIIYIAVLYYKKNPLVSFCIGWFFISLLPVSNIIPSGIFFGERYLYPATLGFCLLLSYLLLRPRKKIFRNLNLTIALFLVIFYSFRAFKRNQVWQDELTFFATEAKMTPGSALQQKHLGLIYIKYGLAQKALEAFERALLLKPDAPFVYFAQGEAFMQLNRFQEALQSYNQALVLKKEFPEVYYNMFRVYLSLNDAQRAQENLRKAIELFRLQGRMQEAATAESVLLNFFNRNHIEENPCTYQ